MRTALSLRLKLLIIMGVSVTVAGIGVSLSLYHSQKLSLLEQLDARLLAAAHFAKATLPADYHDRLEDGNSVSREAFDRLVDRLNGLCTTLGFQYLWSNMVVDGQIVFTTATSPGKDVTKQDHASFFDVHRDPDAFSSVFSSMDVDYSSFRNEWGAGRMVLVPFLDENGRKYCFGASVSTASVTRTLRRTLIHCLLVSSLVLVGTLCVSFFLADSLAKPIQSLTSAAGRIAAGDLGQTARFGGCREVETLSEAVSRMSHAIRDQIGEIQRSHDNLRVTLQSIGDAVIATDTDGKITQMNPVAERLTEWSADEALGRSLNDVFQIVNADSRRAADNPVQTALQSGNVVGLANYTILIGRNGTERQVADSGAPITSVDGKTVGVVLVFRDVTEENMLAEQLRQAQKMDSLGQLAGGVAHDFNNMLGGIVAAADLLGEEVTDDRHRKLADTIIESAMRVSELTRELLAFSRKANVRSEPVDVNRAVLDAVHLLERTIDRRIRIETSLAAQQVCTHGDSAQLENAFLNLGLNARDAMPEGGALRFATSVREIDEETCRAHGTAPRSGGFAEVQVSDTGTGMTKEVRERIFEPFFTTKELGRGTGLGLSAVYGTVREHGGFVDVSSEPGRGTVFRLYLPLSPEPPPPPPERENAPSVLDKTILLVDDEEVIRDSVSALLEASSLQVLLACDGQEAVDIYRERGEEIDLVILDLVMPRMDGPQTVAALKRQDPGVRVLLSSGYSESGVAAELLADPCVRGFIHKPFRLRELNQAVRQALDGAEPTAG